MDDVIALLGSLVALVLAGLAAIIIGDRIRLGTQRAQQEKLSRQQHQNQLTARLEQVDRAVTEQAEAITAVERELAKAVQENDGLRAELDRTEHPFVYTAVPLDSHDNQVRIFRFTARHSHLGEGVPAPDPVAQWDQGRLYAVVAANQAEARSVVDRLLPRQKGFVVVNAGEAISESSPPAL